MANPQYHTLRLILGDQLDIRHRWFGQDDSGILYLIAELHQEATYVRHHVQKLCAFFAAMEQFAILLESRGRNVLHLKLEESPQYDDLVGLIRSVCSRHGIRHFEFQSPDEYRLRQQLRQLKPDTAISVTEYDSDHYLLRETEFARFIIAGKHNRMESFYRKMRKRLNLLMDGDQPLGGQWNYDADNRARLRAADLSEIPEPLLFDNNVEQVLRRIDGCGIDYFGERAVSLLWPINREQSLELLSYFCEQCLHRFGRFQDAMTCEHAHRWSLYHSRLSFALNTKMLHPLEVVDAAISQFNDAGNKVSIAQVEGFVRKRPVNRTS